MFHSRLYRRIFVAVICGVTSLIPATAQTLPQPEKASQPPSFELATKRMDVDVDGAPRAYGPAGSDALDYLRNAHYRGRRFGAIVGYLTEEDKHTPVVQGPNDPAPGFYISQTAFTDPARTDERDVRRYVDATSINYIVLGKEAKKRGMHLGDFVAVYSRVKHTAVFAIAGDDGNPSGNEGSLHLLQALGYPFHDGKNDAVEHSEIIIRFYPNSNPAHHFFYTQAALDAEAKKLGLSRDFAER